MRTVSQNGLGHVVAVAVVALVFGVVGFIGYSLYAKPAAGNGSGTKQNTIVDGSRGAQSAPEIKSADDLDEASATLDQVDTGSDNAKDESTLDTQLNSF